jgi:hypothetical protein
MSVHQPLPICRTWNLNPPYLTNRRSQRRLAPSVCREGFRRAMSQFRRGSAFVVRPQRQMTTLSDISSEILLIGLVVVVPLLLGVSAILFIVQGFRVHWGWGLACILCFPFGGIALFITHRREGRWPMIIWSSGMALGVILLICAFL